MREHYFYSPEFVKMEKKFGWIVVAIACVFLVACKSEQTLIEEAALGYLTAMGNYHIAEAEAYATEETINQTLHFIEETIMPNVDSSYLRQNTPATIEIREINQVDDTMAEVKYVKTTPIQVQDGTLNLVKRDKEWKAQVLIQIPEPLKISHEVDSKKLDEKYRGKVQLGGAKGEVPRRSRSMED